MFPVSVSAHTPDGHDIHCWAGDQNWNGHGHVEDQKGNPMVLFVHALANTSHQDGNLQKSSNWQRSSDVNQEDCTGGCQEDSALCQQRHTAFHFQAFQDARVVHQKNSTKTAHHDHSAPHAADGARFDVRTAKVA